MWLLLQQAGWVLAAIFALSGLAWVLIAWKWLELRGETDGGLDWVQQVLTEVRRGRRREAQRICRQRSTALGRVLEAALRVDQPRRAFFEKQIQPLLEGELAALRYPLPLIGVCGAASPLLGLLGTVLGMAATFGALGGGHGVEVDRLADGISQALLTTQAGLLVALPILLMHGYLSARAGHYGGRIRLHVKQVETALCHD